MNSLDLKKRLLPLLTLLLPLMALASVVQAVPLVFNATETAEPGSIIYLQGDDFGTGAQVWLHRILASDTSLTPDIQLDVLTSSNQAITAQISTYLPLGLYVVWVKDSGGTFSAPVFINKARAMSYEFNEVSPGYSFRIFGRNLFYPGSTPTVSFVNGSNSYAASVVTSYANNGYVLKVTAPAGIVAGTTYTIKVSNGYGHNATSNYDIGTGDSTILARSGGSDPFNLGVPWGTDFTAIAANVINVVSSINPVTGLAYGADPSGAANSLTSIQQALANAGNPTLNPNGATVYLPAGTYSIDKGSVVTAFNIPAKVVLKGAGIGQTIINDSSPALVNYNWFLTFAGTSPNNGSLSGITGFTYNQTSPGLSATLSAPGLRNYAVSSNKMFLDQVEYNGAYGVYGTTGLMCPQFIPQGPGNKNVLVQNCIARHIRFGTANSGPLGYGSDYIFRNNTFTSYFARLEFAYIENLLVENNHFTRDGNFPPVSYNGSITCGGIDPTQPDAKVLNNTLDAINLPLPWRNDGEAILNQNTPPQYDFHTPTSVTATTLTDSSRTWTANIFAGQVLAIVNGPGMGQRRLVTGNTANTITISQPWTKQPTSASTYSLTHRGADRWLVQGNKLSDLPRGIVFYTGGYDSAMVNNSLRDVGETLFLSSGQRTYSSGTTWYGRMDLNWKQVVADNVAVNSKGTWANNTSGIYNGYTLGGNVVAGTVLLGTEYRRNVLQANLTNVTDNTIAQSEGYYNKGMVLGTFTETNIPALLGTVFDDNSAIHTNNAIYVNSDTYQTTIWNQLNMHVTNDVSDTAVSGASHASINTVMGVDPAVVEANFNGTGTGTGGGTDIISTGGLGVLAAGSGSALTSIVSTTPFTAGSGSYMRCSIGTGAGSTGHITVTPTTARTSWGRVFDYRSGKWLVNGGYDFFWRPNQAPTAGNAMRPLDLTNGANGLRFVFANATTTSLTMQVIPPAGGGGLNLVGTYPGGFAANQIYHIGVLFSTDAVSGIITERIFCVAGTGAISTSSTTVGTGGLIAKGTFSLSPSIVTNAGGFLGSGSWNFGDYYGNGVANVNDYEGFNLWAQDPLSFPALP